MRLMVHFLSATFLISGFLIAPVASADQPERMKDVRGAVAHELQSADESIHVDIFAADEGALFLVTDMETGKTSTFSADDLGERSSAFWSSDANTIATDEPNLEYMGTDSTGTSYYAITVDGENVGTMLVHANGDVEIL